MRENFKYLYKNCHTKEEWAEACTVERNELREFEELNTINTCAEEE